MFAPLLVRTTFFALRVRHPRPFLQLSADHCNASVEAVVQPDPADVTVPVDRDWHSKIVGVVKD